jgi:hypothetical protein
MYDVHFVFDLLFVVSIFLLALIPPDTSAECVFATRSVLPGYPRTSPNSPQPRFFLFLMFCASSPGQVIEFLRAHLSPFYSTAAVSG